MLSGDEKNGPTILGLHILEEKTIHGIIMFAYMLGLKIIFYFSYRSS